MGVAGLEIVHQKRGWGGIGWCMENKVCGEKEHVIRVSWIEKTERWSRRFIMVVMKASVSTGTYMNVFVGLYESQRASQSYLYKLHNSSQKWTAGWWTCDWYQNTEPCMLQVFRFVCLKFHKPSKWSVHGENIQGSWGFASQHVPSTTDVPFSGTKSQTQSAEAGINKVLKSASVPP